MHGSQAEEQLWCQYEIFGYHTVDVSIELRIDRVPVATLAAFMQAVSAHTSRDQGELASFAGFSPSTAKRALPTLETLGVIERDADGVYRIAADGVQRGMSDDAAALVLRKALQGFRPFEALVEGLALGEKSATAVRRAAHLVDVDARHVDRLTLLLQLGVDLGILESNGDYKLVAELQPDAVDRLAPIAAGDLESEAKARLYNARRLGRDANNYLDEVDRKLLADSLLAYESDPRKSVADSGQALEDFLREVAVANNLATDVAKLNGAEQVATLLYSNAVIHTHHMKLVAAVSVPRNATSHKKDKKTMVPWEITPLAAFSTHTTTLTIIRSIYAFITNRKQTI